MRRTPAVALALLSLFALGDCNRKPRDPQPATANGLPTAPPQEQNGSSPSLFSASCPTAPLKSAVETGIKNAMVAIYGPDETTMRFSVSSMTQQGDCKTFKVDYKSAGSPGTTMLTYEDDKWSVTLFNKHYPVP